MKLGDCKSLSEVWCVLIRVLSVSGTFAVHAALEWGCLSGVHLGTNTELGDLHAGRCSATAVLCLVILTSAAQHCSDRRGTGLGSGGRTPVWEILQHFKPNLILIWTTDCFSLVCRLWSGSPGISSCQIFSSTCFPWSLIHTQFHLNSCWVLFYALLVTVWYSEFHRVYKNLNLRWMWNSSIIFFWT